SDFDTGTLTVSFAAGSDVAEDRLAIRNQGYGTGEISVAGYGVAYEGTLIGSFTGGTGGSDLVITFNANADSAAVQALIENITYENIDNDNLTTGARTVRFVLSDGDGATSSDYDTTVTVTAVNDAPTFSIGSGILTTAVGSGDDVARSVVVQPDGKILVAGYSDNGSDDDLVILRYDTDGTLDTGFGVNGIITTAVGAGEDQGFSLTLQADGRILLGGSSHNGLDNDFALVMYNSDGSLDTSFSGDGIGTVSFGLGDDIGRAVTIQSDGKILVAGYADNGTNTDFAIVRLNTDGTLDTSFNGDGMLNTDFAVSDDKVFSIALQADDKILVAGNRGFGGSNVDFAVARYNADGTLDTSFSGDGMVTHHTIGNDHAYAILVQPDGKILVGGTSYIGNTSDKWNFSLVRYNADGTLDASFSSDGELTTDLGSAQDWA
ncbi:MAG: hypothetical protein GY722_26090, partial [bacterium]|nr:hypothetical protein [bacterium]